MTDFLHHLRTHPHDAAARLAYCDHLAERGADHRRARLHRDLAERPPAEWNPDELGERLRDLFFAQDRRGRNPTLGCYSTFEYRAGVVELPGVTHPAGDADDYGPLADIHWHRASLDDVECGWWWDGDGTLAFGVCGVWVENTDCKKTRHWRAISGPPWPVA